MGSLTGISRAAERVSESGCPTKPSEAIKGEGGMDIF